MVKKNLVWNGTGTIIFTIIIIAILVVGIMMIFNKKKEPATAATTAAAEIPLTAAEIAAKIREGVANDALAVFNDTTSKPHQVVVSIASQAAKAEVAPIAGDVAKLNERVSILEHFAEKTTVTTSEVTRQINSIQDGSTINLRQLTKQMESLGEAAKTGEATYTAIKSLADTVSGKKKEEKKETSPSSTTPASDGPTMIPPAPGNGTTHYIMRGNQLYVRASTGAYMPCSEPEAEGFDYHYANGYVQNIPTPYGQLDTYRMPTISRTPRTVGHMEDPGVHLKPSYRRFLY